jgi:hypothetical protein
VVLQNCVSLLKVEPGSYNVTSHAGDQVVNVKAEEFSDVEEEKCPVPVIKAEDEVSCVCLCVLCYSHVTDI